MMTKSRLAIIEMAPKLKFKNYVRRPCLQNNTQDVIKTWISFNNHDLIKKLYIKHSRSKIKIILPFTSWIFYLWSIFHPSFHLTRTCNPELCFSFRLIQVTPRHLLHSFNASIFTFSRIFSHFWHDMLLF